MLKKNPLLVSLVLAIFATFFIYSYLSNREKALLELSTPVDVVVAARDLPAGTSLTEDMLEIARIPKKYVQPGAVSTREKVLEQTTGIAVLSGTQISEGMFQGEGNVSFAEKVPKDKRAVTLAVSKVTAVANMLTPGNYIDLLVTVNIGHVNENGQEETEEVLTATFLQNKLVLAVDENSSRRDTMRSRMQANSKGSLLSRYERGDRENKDIGTLTLALSPEETQLVTLAQELGSISVALRSQWDSGEEQSLKIINSEDLLGIKKRVIRKSSPAWIEIRGAEQKMYE